MCVFITCQARLECSRYGLDPALAIGAHISMRTHGSFLTSHPSKLPWVRNGLNCTHCDSAPSQWWLQKTQWCHQFTTRWVVNFISSYPTGTYCCSETWNWTVWPPEWWDSKTPVSWGVAAAAAAETSMLPCCQGAQQKGCRNATTEGHFLERSSRTVGPRVTR